MVFTHFIECARKKLMEVKAEAVAMEPNNDVLLSEHRLKQETIEKEEIQVKCNDTITEQENYKIELMRAVIEKQDPSSKEVDEYALRRFLRARDLDVEKASTMFLKYLKWRQSFVPKGSISACEIPNEIAQNKMFMQGVDKQGRPIAVVFGGRHIQNKIGGVEEFKRFIVFALDKLCARTSPGREKFVIIGDLQGFGYSSSDVRAYLAALSIVQDCYPERLGKVLLVNVPYLFCTLWKMLCPFIDNNTKKKIVFVENKRLRATLLQDINESQLPEAYGGKMPLVPIQDA
ncbi:PREDICTED: patellin-4-like isoform X2 [Nicotiana attenuata]|uniref:patellin-4-like isoform X2 n=1 Tax=Nicotiana attenuata TaxID=49451 RepID=UPI00090550C6|nr:PREDICTED: patellin-4-like isoform X2 [Nicotiana attenuata]